MTVGSGDVCAASVCAAAFFASSVCGPVFCEEEFVTLPSPALFGHSAFTADQHK